MTSVCRACLISDGQLLSLLRNEEAMQSFLDLTGLQISPNDGLPLSICGKCIELLHEFSNFREQIIRNHFILLESVSQKINLLTNKTVFQKRSKRSTKNETNLLDEPQPTVKEEIEVMYLKSETYDDDILVADDELCKKEKNIADVKNKKRNPKKIPSIRIQKPKPTKTRVFIHVDPEKITVLRLSEAEQRLRHKAEAEKAEYRDMPYKCLSCYKGFNYERKLKAHLENYHKANSAFECAVCTRTMSNAASLALHLKKHELLYECNICKATFAEKPRAILHYKSAHEGIEAEYPCKQCDRVFRNRSTLHGHVRSHHPRRERPSCALCQKSFVSQDSYHDHMLIHTGERNYTCEVCGARFRLRQSARAHMRSHTNLRHYYCAPCDAAFKSRSSYAHHLNTASAHVAEHVKAKNTCTICNRQFSTRYTLKKHVATHSGARYTCDTCGASVRGVARREHEARHSRGEVARVTSVCHYCGKGFATRRTLENHILVHTGARPHACALCDARFTQRATLRTHIKRRHPSSDVTRTHTADDMS